VQLLLSSLVAASVREKISALCFEKKSKIGGGREEYRTRER
jgi:hypothetical protein